MTAPVLVSGGAGYLGSHVVLALVEAGYPVVVLDDLSSGARAAVPAGVELVVADCGDARAAGAAIRSHGVEAAVHLAASPGPPGAEGPARRSHRAGAAFVRICAAGGVMRFAMTSSAAVYGGGGARPSPLGPYGAWKLATERAVHAAFAGPGCRHAVLRCFNVAGADPAGRAGPRPGAPGLVQAACEAALGLRAGVTVHGDDWATPDGACVRDWVHAADAAAAHVAALWALEAGAGGGPDGLTLDCGSGRGRSVREVLAAVQRVSGRTFPVRAGPRRPGDPEVSVARPASLRRLGWRPRYGADGDGFDALVSTALAWSARRGPGLRRAASGAGPGPPVGP